MARPSERRGSHGGGGGAYECDVEDRRVLGDEVGGRDRGARAVQDHQRSDPHPSSDSVPPPGHGRGAATTTAVMY